MSRYQARFRLPWQGDSSAIPDSAKRGELIFFRQYRHITVPGPEPPHLRIHEAPGRILLEHDLGRFDDNLHRIPLFQFKSRLPLTRRGLGLLLPLSAKDADARPEAGTGTRCSLRSALDTAAVLRGFLNTLSATAARMRSFKAASSTLSPSW